MTKAFQKSFKLNPSNGDPEGVAFDGTNYFVVDEEDKKIYQYNTTGAFIKTIPIGANNGDA